METHHIKMLRMTRGSQCFRSGVYHAAPYSQFRLSFRHYPLFEDSSALSQRHVLKNTVHRAPSYSKIMAVQPRVGVAATVLRFLQPPAGSKITSEVLLIERGKDPAKGFWSFPGGGLEPGEKLVTAAAREIREETQLTDICWLDVYRATDAIYYQQDQPDKLAFHYTVVHVLGITMSSQNPVASDDATDVDFVPCHEFFTGSHATHRCHRLLVPRIASTLSRALRVLKNDVINVPSPQAYIVKTSLNSLLSTTPTITDE